MATREERREITRLLHDIEDQVVLIKACIRDQQWLYAALTLSGLLHNLEQVKRFLDRNL